MSDRLEVSAKVESAVNQCEFISSADVEAINDTEGEGFSLTLSISSAVEEGDDEADESDDDASPSNSSAVDEGEADDDEADESDESSPSNSSAVDEGTTYPEGDDEEYCCPLCGDYEGSKAQVSGHKGHCDGSPSNSSAVEGGTDESDDDTSSSNSSAVDKEEVAHPEEAENPTKENYTVHYGVCIEEGCDYGANGEEADYCASHQNGSSDNDGSSSNSSAVDKSYDDLTEGQKKAVNNLLEEKADDDSFGVEEAIQMV